MELGRLWLEAQASRTCRRLFQPYLSVLRTPAVTAPHTNFLRENSLSWGSFGGALSPE